MYYRWMVEQFFIGFFCAVVVRCMLLAARAAASCVRWRVASLHVSRVDSCAYDAYYALLVGLERPTNH
jgi:hypothetical protein